MLARQVLDHQDIHKGLEYSLLPFLWIPGTTDLVENVFLLKNQDPQTTERLIEQIAYNKIPAKWEQLSYDD